MEPYREKSAGKAFYNSPAEKARSALGERFDIRDFHDLVLTGGPVPLKVLGDRVEAWIGAGSAE